MDNLNIEFPFLKDTRGLEPEKSYVYINGKKFGPSTLRSVFLMIPALSSWYIPPLPASGSTEKKKTKFFKCPDCNDPETPVTEDLEAARKMSRNEVDHIKTKLGCKYGCNVSFKRLRDRIPIE